MNTPFVISSRTAEMLEWPAFLRLYANFVDSPAGREKVLRIQPCEDLERQWQLTRESLACAQKLQIPAFGSLENVELILQKAAIENDTLEGIQCRHVLR